MASPDDEYALADGVEERADLVDDGLVAGGGDEQLAAAAMSGRPKTGAETKRWPREAWASARRSARATEIELIET